MSQGQRFSFMKTQLEEHVFQQSLLGPKFTHRSKLKFGGNHRPVSIVWRSDFFRYEGIALRLAMSQQLLRGSILPQTGNNSGSPTVCQAATWEHCNNQ